MKQMLEHIKKNLITHCKRLINQDIKTNSLIRKTAKESALYHFNLGNQSFTDLFDTEEEVLQWLEDEKMI